MTSSNACKSQFIPGDHQEGFNALKAIASEPACPPSMVLSLRRGARPGVVMSSRRVLRHGHPEVFKGKRELNKKNISIPINEVCQRSILEVTERKVSLKEEKMQWMPSRRCSVHVHIL